MVTTAGIRREFDSAPITPARSAPPGFGRVDRTRIAVGVVIVVVSVLASVTVYTHVAQRRAVLRVAHHVDVGQQIRGSDLAVTEVGASPHAATVTAADRARIVGQVARVELVPGALLAPRQFQPGPAVQPDTAVVGALLKAGQYPVGLHRGDVVRVVQLASATDDVTLAGTDRGTAAVVDISPTSDDNLSVSLSVPLDAARDVAAAGAAGRLSLIVVSRP
jgi:hypothetical protein